MNMEYLRRVTIETAYEIQNRICINGMALVSINGDGVKLGRGFQNDRLKNNSGAICMAIWNIVIRDEHKGYLMIQFEKRVNDMPLATSTI